MKRVRWKKKKLNILGYSFICSALRNEKIPCTWGESFRIHVMHSIPMQALFIFFIYFVHSMHQLRPQFFQEPACYTWTLCTLLVHASWAYRPSTIAIMCLCVHTHYWSLHDGIWTLGERDRTEYGRGQARQNKRGEICRIISKQ